MEEIHKVPNICIGKWEAHSMVRALIPELYDPQTCSPHLTQEDQKTFYEEGLLPAVQALCEDSAHEWPATYDDEMFRARGQNGTLSFQTKVIPSWSVRSLGKKIRAYLRRAGIPWGSGIVFLHQVRGVKHSSRHRLDNEAAREALMEFLRSVSLNPERVSLNGSWWVDVGVEISSEENCLAWRTDSHVHLAKAICGIDDLNARRITSRRSSKYARDMISHLPQVSGCRIQPGVRGQGPNQVAYLQLYCTDKSLTYRVDKGHYGKFITCDDIVKRKADKFLDSLYLLYINAADRHNAHARMEIRVPLQFAPRVLLDIDNGLLFESLVSFPAKEWW